MRVDITDATDVPLQLCVACGKAYAVKVGARWPEPHEHAASTRIGRERITIRVTEAEADCEWCAATDERFDELTDFMLGPRPDEREKGDDDGVEYADPRDEREERRR